MTLLKRLSRLLENVESCHFCLEGMLLLELGIDERKQFLHKKTKTICTVPIAAIRFLDSKSKVCVVGTPIRLLILRLHPSKEVCMKQKTANWRWLPSTQQETLCSILGHHGGGLRISTDSEESSKNCNSLSGMSSRIRNKFMADCSF